MVPLCGDAPARAGPPLVTDDPHPAATGQLEVIAALTHRRRPGGSESGLPLLDLAYGAAPDVEVFVAVPWQRVDPAGGPAQSDPGPLTIGAKWRFLSPGAEGLAASLAPAVAFDAGDPEVDGTALSWPLDVEWRGGGWLAGAELLYQQVLRDRDAWQAGLVLGRAFPGRGAPSWLLLELRGSATPSLDERELVGRIGVDAGLGERLRLLAAVGRELGERGGDDVRLSAYLGLQVFLGPWSPGAGRSRGAR